MRWIFRLLVLCAMLTAASTARAGEEHYLVMFGAQRIPANPKYAHTFATFVRATWPGDCPQPQNATLEVHTISWLPATGVIRIAAVLPEEGRNFGLDETIRWCACNDMRVSIWGAYRIDAELYCRAVNQVALLNSGRIKFQSLDAGRSTDRASNCIHAVSSLSQGVRLFVASPGWGESASYFVLKELEPWICDTKQTHPWVGSAIGLDQHCLIYRDYQNPRSNAVFGPILRLLGSERNLQATMGPPVR